MWDHVHALNVGVDLEWAVAVLDGMKSEGRLYSAVIGPVRPSGLDATRALS
jgi:hypothetical protein